MTDDANLEPPSSPVPPGSWPYGHPGGAPGQPVAPESPTHPGQPMYPPPQAYQPYPAAEQSPGRGLLLVVVGIVIGVVVLTALAAGGAWLVLRSSSSSADQSDVIAVPADPSTAPTASTAPVSPTPSGPSPSPSGQTPAAAPPSRPGPSSGPAQAGSQKASTALAKGDCIRTLPTGQTIYQVSVVACTTPHAAQVGATFTPAAEKYLGTAEYETLIQRECPTRLGRVIRDDAPPLNWTGYYPELLEFAGGHRSIKCLLVPRDGKPLTRSVVK